MSKVVKLNPRYIEEAKTILANMPDEDIQNVSKFLAARFLEEIKQGLDGEIARKDAPFFDLVERAYDEVKIKGCYFCDHDIDGNAVPFDPDKTKVCLSCQLKIANLLKAFDIDHQVLFPGMGERKRQKVLFKELKATDKLGYH